MKKMVCIGALLCGAFLAGARESADPIAALRESMVLVEGGAYLRGSTEQPYASTERVHEATVSSFLIAATETTQALWREVTGKNPSAFKGDQRPVENVSWLDAVRFCNALSESEGLEKAYEIAGSNVTWNRQADGYRLPTEAEWEYAARGGRLGAIGDSPLAKAPYAGGADAASVAWFDRNSSKTSQNVARKAANELGLYDMSGNVWEWCWDWYGDYPREQVSDPEGGPRGAGQKVLRGGAWFTPMNLLRVTYRYWSAPTFKVNSVGFRLARNAVPFGLETAAHVDFFEALSAPDSDH
jgi:formylglycine-generating enzyme required for sulfatase activity